MADSREDLALAADRLLRADSRLELLDGQSPPAPFLRGLIDAAHSAFAQEGADGVDAAEQSITFPDPHHFKGRRPHGLRKLSQLDQGVGHRLHRLHRLLIPDLHVLQDDGLVSVRSLISQVSGIVKEIVGEVIAEHPEHRYAPGKSSRHAEGHCLFKRARARGPPLFFCQVESIDRRFPLDLNGDDPVRLSKVLDHDLHDNVQHVEHFREAVAVSLVVIVTADAPVAVQPLLLYIFLIAVIPLCLFPVEGPASVRLQLSALLDTFLFILSVFRPRVKPGSRRKGPGRQRPAPPAPH